MSISYMDVENHTRSNSASAVGKAAYCAGERLHCEERDKYYNYTKKKGVIYSEIVLCENAPEEYRDRETLWNAVEKVEKASDARLSREFICALPRETTDAENIAIGKKFAKVLADQGMIVDWAYHNKGDGNPHLHFLATTRAIDKNGNWCPKEIKRIAHVKEEVEIDGVRTLVDKRYTSIPEDKEEYLFDEVTEPNDEGEMQTFYIERIPIIDEATGKQKIGARNRKQWKRETIQANYFNNRGNMEYWRKSWADICNQYLSKNNQIDMRSYERQGVDMEGQIHEGFAARELDERMMREEGKHSDRVQYNIEVRAANKERARRAVALSIIATLIKMLGGKIKELVAELEELKTSKENMKEVLSNVSIGELLGRSVHRGADAISSEVAGSTSSERGTGEEESGVDFTSLDLQIEARRAREAKREADKRESRLGGKTFVPRKQRQGTEFSQEPQKAGEQHDAERKTHNLGDEYGGRSR